MTGWWLLANSHGGAHVASGDTVGQAKADARQGIADAFVGEDLARTAAERGAYSYRLRVVAGPLALDEARRALAAWDREDWSAALVHARPHWRVTYGLDVKEYPPAGQFVDLIALAESGEDAGTVEGLGEWKRVSLVGKEMLEPCGGGVPIPVKRLLGDSRFRLRIRRAAEVRREAARGRS